MARIIKTSPIPEVPTVGPEEFTVVTPHRAAAKSIGVGQKSLEKLARRTVRAKGFGIAPPMVALGTLKRACRNVLKDGYSPGVVPRISQILKTVLRTGIAPKTLIEKGSSQVRELGSIAEEYVRLLREQKMIDSEETLLFAAALSPEKKKILVYGYFRGRTEETIFIDAVADEGSVFYLPVHGNHAFKVNRERAAWLESRGWVSDSAEPPSEALGAAVAARFVDAAADDVRFKVSAHVYSDIDSEIRGTLTDIKKLVIDGVRPRDIGILCRNSKNYGPLVAPVAEEYGMRIDMTYGVAISETGFGGFVDLVLDTMQEFEFENVLRVFMHPFGQKLSDEQLEKAYKFHPRTKEDWFGLGVFTHSLDAPERAKRHEWNKLLQNIFDVHGVKERLSARTRELIAYERFREALREFCFEPHEELSRVQWISEVVEIMNSVNIPFSPSNGGIAFHDPDTVIGGSLKHLFVIGASEGTLPAGVSENPVVDFYERKKLAEHGAVFEGAGDVPRWEAMSFYFSLLAASESITISHPENVNTESRIKSSFFDGLGLDPLSRPLSGETVSSIRELRRADLRTGNDSDDEVLGHARTAFKVESKRESEAPQDEFDGNTGIPYENPAHVWSVSQLTTIGQCGFRWFAGKLLQLEPIEEMDGELIPSTRGTLYHRALELAVEKAGDGEDIRAGILAVLNESFAEAEADPEVGLPRLSNWETERLEHIEILRRAVESPEFIGSDTKIIGTEVKFDSHWKGFKLTGYIDRLDRTPDGIVAIDYKTSSSPPKGAKDSSGKPKLDIQLPLYLKSAVPSLTHLSDGEEGVAGSYYSLIKGTTLKKADLDKEDELEAFAERVKKMLASGDFSVDPDAKREACRYCDYTVVCRDGSRIKRKEVMQNEADA